MWCFFSDNSIIVIFVIPAEYNNVSECGFIMYIAHYYEVGHTGHTLCV